MFKQLKIKYRYSAILMRELVRSGFKLRYQDSALGYLWSLLKPIFLFTVLYIVLVGFLGIGAGDPTWPVSLLLGIVLWNFFAEITGMGLTSVVDRGDIIRKVNFPKYVIVLSNSFLALINLLLNFIVIAIFMVINHVYPTWSALMLPVYVIELFVFALGLAFFLSAVFVKLRDINYIWEIIMQALFYGSVVMFPLATVIHHSRKFAEVLLLNPITSAIQGARHVLVNAEKNPTLFSMTHNVWLTTIPVIIIIAVFIFGAMYFRRRSPHFAEEI